MIGILSRIGRYYAPPAPAPRLPDDEVRARYPVFRWRTMEATFLGYAMFYLVRNNIGTVAKDIESALHYNKSMVGDILAVSALSYGLSKFLMGSVSDRSDARKFMATGLLLSAVCNFAFGASSNFQMHLALWALNGFVQGMGWPPCGRSMGHWFSESERGLTFSIWNVSHNVGGGIAGVLAAWAVEAYGGWRYAFYAPGVAALFGAVYIFWRLRDTPQSVGLPPIEEYRNDYPIGHDPGTGEQELTFRELFFDKVLLNKYVWVLALANFFAYVTRYSMLAWGPTYLREVKGASLSDGGWAILALEFGGIPSTILLGWLSDRLGGRRCMIAALCMIPVFGAFLAILFTPAGYLWIDMLMLITIGFFIYPVINLIVIAALDIVSKKAIGAAAGFIGLFGYAGNAAQAKAFGWAVDHFGAEHGVDTGWRIVLYSILACAALAFLLLAVVWNLRTRSE